MNINQYRHGENNMKGLFLSRVEWLRQKIQNQTPIKRESTGTKLWGLTMRKD